MSESPSLSPPALRVWLVHADVAFRAAFCAYLSHTTGVGDVKAFATVVQVLREGGRPASPDVVVIDAPLVTTGGISTCQTVRGAFPRAVCLVLTPGFDAALTGAASGLRALPRHVPLDVLVGLIMQARKSVVGTSVLTAYGLTRRERDVLQALAEGLSQKQIGERLSIGASTVNSHVQRLFEKLRVNTATGAVAKAVREHLV